MFGLVNGREWCHEHEWGIRWLSAWIWNRLAPATVENQVPRHLIPSPEAIVEIDGRAIAIEEDVALQNRVGRQRLVPHHTCEKGQSRIEMHIT